VITSDTLPERIGRHYQIESLLGSGGTSRVLQAVDLRSGERLALKQALITGASQRARAEALLRQEFHVLSRIEHPNVVRAFEYGVEAGRPFYSMELIGGRSLSELAPLPWQRLCAILLDLCSPLSLLHSRRFVHCDVTARNVLVTEHGVTKLIDFGALTALDRPAVTIAGTPPHMAPELVRKQSIDGRVDMFALGALAYSLLAGQHAYPARTIHELPQTWAIAPSTLLELELDIPAELDHLIMSLLSLDVSARPLQLAELVRRLSAILGEAYAPGRASLRAQLATPKLVGREPELEQFRQALHAASDRRGSLLCITGAKGVGRSRLLEACTLEAIRAGQLVVQLSAEQATRVPFGLFAQVLQAACTQEPRLFRLLPPAIGAAIASSGEDASEVAQQLAAHDAEAREACWSALGSQRTAVVLIDDLTRADVESIQACLALAISAKRLPLLLAASIGAGETALDRDVAALFSRHRTLHLDALSEPETAQLLRSVFGDVAGLEALVAWAHRAAAGVPGACVELAHHAVEQGYVRFLDGQFWVSDEFRTGRAALPRALDEAVAGVIEALSSQAREALAVLSLLTPFGRLTTPEQVELLCAGGWTDMQALDALDTLRDAQLINLVGDGYELRFEDEARRATGALPAELVRTWHGRLARYYAQRGHDYAMLSVLHHDLAGERETAYRNLIALDAKLQGPDDPNIKLGGSQLGRDLHQRMLQHALDSAAPRCEVVHFRRLLVSIGSTADVRLCGEGPQLLEALTDDVGLSFWAEADAALSDHDKLLFCLTRAQERFTRAEPGERLSPIDAIRRLAEAVAALSAMAGSTFDAAASAVLVESFRPLRTLAPVLDLTYRVVEATSRVLSRGGRELERWSALLADLQQPPDNLPELIWRYMQSGMHFSLGRERAQLGEASALRHAAALAANQRTQPQACSVRLLYALAHGDHKTAAEQRRQRAIAALASRHEDQRLPASYLGEVVLLDGCGDLLELQPAAAWFEAKAAEIPSYRPVAAFARACCLLQCGQALEAEPLIEAQLSAAPPLGHGAWYLLRGLRAEIALLRGHVELAQQIAGEVLQIAAGAQVDTRPDTRAQRVLALARAQLGDTRGALTVLDPLLDELAGTEEANTVRAGQLHDTRARVYLLAGDRERFWGDYTRVQTIYGRYAHPGLMARLQRLSSVATQSQNSRTVSAQTTQHKLNTLRTDLSQLEDDAQLGYLLDVLLRDAQASSGYLYVFARGRPAQCVAAQGGGRSDAALDAQVDLFAQRLAASDSELTQSLDVAADELTIIRSLPSAEEESLCVVPLRGSAGVLHGLALLRSSSAAGVTSRTEGLSTIAADVLAQLA